MAQYGVHNNRSISESIITIAAATAVIKEEDEEEKIPSRNLVSLLESRKSFVVFAEMALYVSVLNQFPLSSTTIGLLYYNNHLLCFCSCLSPISPAERCENLRPPDSFLGSIIAPAAYTL